MNTETLQNKASNTIGKRLRQARENMGLSQKTVAEKLYLKVLTIQEIEEDYINPNLASTFLHGYIRSYANLVQIPEEELTPMIAKQAPIKSFNVIPIQYLSLDKTSKTCDNWLIIVTWVILFTVISLTGTWWWQNHRAYQQDIARMADQLSIHLSLDNNKIITPFNNNTNDINQPLTRQSSYIDKNIQTATTTPNTSNKADSSILPTSTTIKLPNIQDIIELKNTANAYNHALAMKFIGDCWLVVYDAEGKKLFSGMKYSGSKLNLTGEAPYKLKIGAPAAIQIQYHGKPIDLSRFIKLNQVAQLTIDAK